MRRVWIIAEKTVPEQSDLDDAQLNGCPEVVNGIPLALQGVISAGQLPYAYEEPVEPLPEPPRSSHISTLEAVDPTKARPARIKRVWQGIDYYYDCFATQTVRDEFIAAKIVIGDYVIVHFDDVGEQIVMAKVFKSW